MIVNPFSYLIEKLKGKVNKSGDTMTGNLTVDLQNGTTVTEGLSHLYLGNSTPTGTTGNSTGLINLYGSNGKRVILYAPADLTGNNYVAFPSKAGTLALTSDIANKAHFGQFLKSSAVSSFTLNLDVDSDVIQGLLIVNGWTDALTNAYVGVVQIRTNTGTCSILDIISGNTNTKPTAISFDTSTKVVTFSFGASATKFATFIYS